MLLLSCKVEGDALVVLLCGFRTWSTHTHNIRDHSSQREKQKKKKKTCTLLTNDVCVDLHLAVLLRQLEGLVVALRQNQEVDGRAVVVQPQKEPKPYADRKKAQKRLKKERMSTEWQLEDRECPDDVRGQRSKWTDWLETVGWHQELNNHLNTRHG